MDELEARFNELAAKIEGLDPDPELVKLLSEMIAIESLLQLCKAMELTDG